MKRLLWLNVVALLLFAGLAGSDYYRSRARRSYELDTLLAPIAAAHGEAELRTRAEALARAAHSARRAGGHYLRASVWLGVAAAFLALVNVFLIRDYDGEIVQLRDDSVRRGQKRTRTLPSVEVVLKRFESPDEVRTFEKGRLEIVRIGGVTIGRASYEPGWKWSKHVGPAVGTALCPVEHVGMVLSGTATVAFDDGRVIELVRDRSSTSLPRRTTAG